MDKIYLAVPYEMVKATGINALDGEFAKAVYPLEWAFVAESDAMEYVRNYISERNADIDIECVNIYREKSIVTSKEAVNLELCYISIFHGYGAYTELNYAVSMCRAGAWVGSYVSGRTRLLEMKLFYPGSPIPRTYENAPRIEWRGNLT